MLLTSVAYPASPGWPEQVQEIRLISTADQTEQPSLTWSPTDDKEARPLLVGLHTWSGDYHQAANGKTYVAWAMQEGWHFVYPNFRGPNRTPEALGSDLAVQDVVDAVEHMKRTKKVDAARIYLIGVSGGGHMAMLMAARHPEIWAGVSAWVGISDVAEWHRQHVKEGKPDRYALDIEGALGGPPDTPDRVKGAKHRSPLNWLANAKAVPLDLNHGIHDGRTGSVPFSHSLLAFNAVVDEAERLPTADITSYYETQALPAGWGAAEEDPLYVEKKVLFRRSWKNTRVTLFEGGHEILYAPSLNWLAVQQKGSPAVWTIPDPKPVPAGDTRSGL